MTRLAASNPVGTSLVTGFNSGVILRSQTPEIANKIAKMLNLIETFSLDTGNSTVAMETLKNDLTEIKSSLSLDVEKAFVSEDEICASRGPRIGDNDSAPRCAEKYGHEHSHKGYKGSGFENVYWGEPMMRDAEFARDWANILNNNEEKFLETNQKNHS